MAEPAAIGVFSPGAMGAALGRAWQRGGARVVTTVAGRSARTRALADGLELLGGLGEVVDAAGAVILIGPPGEAPAMAAALVAACRERGRRPLVAELNALAPAAVRRIGEDFLALGCEFVDGAISGPPPREGGHTRLYLSGAGAGRLAGLAAPGVLARVVGAEVGAASAVKMSTASIYKGLVALLLHALYTARANGVTELVLADLEAARLDRIVGEAGGRIAEAGSKAARFADEMREIAATQAAAGLTPLLFDAFAAVYEAVALTPLAELSPEQAAAVTDLGDALARLDARGSA